MCLRQPLASVIPSLAVSAPSSWSVWTHLGSTDIQIEGRVPLVVPNGSGSKIGTQNGTLVNVKMTKTCGPLVVKHLTHTQITRAATLACKMLGKQGAGFASKALPNPSFMRTPRFRSLEQTKRRIGTPKNVWFPLTSLETLE